MSINITVEELQAAGFPMGGEPLVALDLADTVMTVKDPPIDLIGDPAAGAAWWNIQARRLPPGPTPDPAAARRLRTAIRDVLDAQVRGRTASAASVEDINATASSVPRSPRLVTTEQGVRQETRWHVEHGGNAALAAIAGEVIGLLASPERLGLVRICDNPDCSMLFLAENKRRKWCVGNICGNRARVARHYGRTHSQDT
ncbi:CGNR zinc finger domain-containing protein [Streptomyces sp. AK02-01A]|uniref:CGNR zinc finger domain-containing protein n=1 Tax=Streptomyces sp. AK02-01A TaxID=3028648 RepID=UPI0029BC8B52|nr:ABATE domain-containing protein [Streptomyces sp. AK02-01A]MDX3849959.1 ABATE domain-containing protein [Streptomyces sp. AK02-01A]